MEMMYIEKLSNSIFIMDVVRNFKSMLRKVRNNVVFPLYLTGIGEFRR